MKVLIVFGHPNHSSFNGAIRDAVKDELEKSGAEIRVKDLYQSGFNPALSSDDLKQIQSGNPPSDIKSEQADVTWAEVIIMISPVWWHGVTSMLRGYIDRVFSYKFAYDYDGPGPRGLLGGRKGLLITTSGASQQVDQQTHMTDNIRHTFVGGFFGFCGITQADYINCFDVTNVSDDERRKMLDDIKSFIRSKLQ